MNLHVLRAAALTLKSDAGNVLGEDADDVTFSQLIGKSSCRKQAEAQRCSFSLCPLLMMEYIMS